MPKFLLIVNPISGNGHSLKLLPSIEEQLRSFDLDFSVVVTERPMHAAKLAEQAVIDGVDGVVAVGGDGTANEVLNGLMAARKNGKSAVMAFIPVGRGNDFAFGAGAPLEWKSACQALADGKTRWIDVGRVSGGLVPEGRYFGNGVGIGFDAVVGFEALKLRPLSGFAVYLLAALRTIFLYFTAPLVNIKTDDREIEQNSLMVSVMNGRRMGGGFMMAPQGIPDDGSFDVCLAKHVSKIGIFKIIPKFMSGTQYSDPAITGLRTRKISVTGLNGGMLPAHADGETINIEGKYLEIEIHHLAQEVIVGSTGVQA